MSKSPDVHMLMYSGDAGRVKEAYNGILLVMGCFKMDMGLLCGFSWPVGLDRNVEQCNFILLSPL